MAMKPTAKESVARLTAPKSDRDHAGSTPDSFFDATASKVSADLSSSYLRPTSDGAQGSDGVVVILGCGVVVTVVKMAAQHVALSH